MRKVGIVVDSTFGLSEEFVKKHHIDVVRLKVIIGNDTYEDGNFDPAKVVEALQHKVSVKTSQPTPEQFMEAMNRQLAMYEEVICMTLSKTLSGTLNSAALALTILENKNVHVIDSETTINGGAYLTEKLIEYLDEGHQANEGLAYIEEVKEKGSLIFTVNDLQTLHHNGRLGLISTFIGNILRVKPILRFKKGVLELEHKVRGIPKAMEYLIDETKKLLAFSKKVIVRIAFVDRSIEAKELEGEIYQLGDSISVKITGVISPVVSAHVGLGGLGVYLAYE